MVRVRSIGPTDQQGVGTFVQYQSELGRCRFRNAHVDTSPELFRDLPCTERECSHSWSACVGYVAAQRNHYSYAISEVTH